MLKTKRRVAGRSYIVTAGWKKGPVLDVEFHVQVLDAKTGEIRTDIPVRNGGPRRRGSITLPFQPRP